MNGKAQWIVTGWLLVALSPLLAGAAVNNATAPMDDEARPMERAGEFHPKLEKANELIGAKVVNDKRQELGTIEDIVLTPDRSAVSYAVLSHGGFWGFGGKLFAVPWSQFKIGTEKNVLILSSVTKADLENAKGLTKDKWPVVADENWLGREMPEGARPMAVETPPAPAPADERAVKADIKYRRLSTLVGLTVKNDQGEELGELEDIVIDTHEGKVAYAVLSMRSGFLGLNKELAAIPWSSFRVIPQLGTARLDADKETLRTMAFNADEFPDLEDMEYSRQVHERFGATPYWEAFGFVPGRDEKRPEVSPWKEGSEYDSLYDARNSRTIHGTIVSVGTFRLEGTPVEGLRLRVKTQDGDTVTVHAGPRPYVESQKIAFHYGDEVTVTGSPGKLGWRDVIVASQIKKGDNVLDLRTKDGKPRWNVDDFKEDR